MKTNPLAWFVSRVKLFMLAGLALLADAALPRRKVNFHLDNRTGRKLHFAYDPQSRTWIVQEVPPVPKPLGIFQPDEESTL